MRPDALDALAGLLVAAGVTAALTPVSAMFARRVGAVDAPRERGLGPGGTPLLGGLAIYAGVVVGMLLMLDVDAEYVGVLLGATVITLVGALDDRFDLLPGVKLAGQILAAVIPVHYGVVVDNVTVPFLGPVDFGWLGAPLTVLGMVAVMNIVNFSDGVDGLAAGVAMISAAAFAVIAFDLGRHEAGVLSAVVAGAALGFLVFNFPPASSYMGDCGANLLGLLLACIAVLGAVKTNAVLALILPLLVLAVPFLDTTFVVLKRLKYHRPVYEADREHFHHRLDRIGFSPGAPRSTSTRGWSAWPRWRSRCASSRTATTAASCTSAGPSSWAASSCSP
ncbi:undecaprenyl/decaprenyl-phosphate alpha-N-acetylglucosaminyl 1-phosphate transferase [Svornostia abyssi]|uniref:Undecaprenyl/decaprenyl-phosphate alpha-N-acetylglucosaminyl 1-phosphate transferase n=1 Tax=Svornostia abyssi TaxID=2898438 RepID=A0ABY5PN95_9ACTN|nr:undecaprenyl/decaprenyl-phosphate alpha-N-acetylglucosaminyl 1-phosphate transferase [Parviterribacteraceae bacterium J379]